MEELNNKEIKIEELSDAELLAIVDEFQKEIIDNDSIIRKLSKQYFGGETVTQMMFVAYKILPIVAERMKCYSPHLNINNPHPVLKSEEENPNGLFNKYVISRTDGTPINPENIYFLLKLEGEGDPIHIEACQKAVLKYADEIESHIPQLAKDLRERYFLNSIE